MGENALALCRNASNEYWIGITTAMCDATRLTLCTCVWVRLCKLRWWPAVFTTLKSIKMNKNYCNNVISAYNLIYLTLVHCVYVWTPNAADDVECFKSATMRLLLSLHCIVSLTHTVPGATIHKRYHNVATNNTFIDMGMDMGWSTW